MKLIGRKLYLNWGKCVISIEKIMGHEGQLERCGLIKDGEVVATCLFDLYQVGNTVIEKNTGTVTTDCFGETKCYPHTLERAFTTKEMWQTEEEYEQNNKS